MLHQQTHQKMVGFCFILNLVCTVLGADREPRLCFGRNEYRNGVFGVSGGDNYLSTHAIMS